MALMSSQDLLLTEFPLAVANILVVAARVVTLFTLLVIAALPPALDDLHGFSKADFWGAIVLVRR
jgi:hypothetical protein